MIKNRHCWNRTIIALSIALGAILILFRETAVSIVQIWNSSETFAHGYIIVPVSLWLAWQRRKQLVQEVPRPDWRAFVLLAGAVFGWLLADLGGVQVVEQYALVAMLPLVVWGLLGWGVTRHIIFPLGFLLLAVPFGEVFIDPLIDITADFTVYALQLTGIPVFREGNSFAIPSGNWSVVTACSGVRYLIASFTLGCIYAYLTYRGLWRRMLFVIAAILVPIVANGLRAYMIVMIGHFSGMKYAVGFDHLIYGWLFFGLVMLIMFWVGSFWREDESPDQDQLAPIQATPASAAALAFAAIAALVIVGAGQGYAGYLDRAIEAPATVLLEAPTVVGWSESAEPFTSWRAEFRGPAGELTRYYAKAEQQAGLYIAYYRNQQQGAELISSVNVLASPEGKTWRRLGESGLRLHAGNFDFAARESRLTNGDQRLLAWHWYWVGGRFTTNLYLAKLHQAWDRLLLRGDDGAVVVLFVPLGERREPAAATLQDLAQVVLPGVERSLQAAKKK